MKIKNSEIGVEENGLVLKRCVSTYKQEFLSMDRTNFVKQVSSPSERENNLNPTYATHENLEIISSNVHNKNNNLCSDKKCNKIIFTDKPETSKKFQNKKIRKLGSIFFQTSVRRNFSPQILKSKIDFDPNYLGKNVSTAKHSKNLIKTNTSSNANDNYNVINNDNDNDNGNGSTKNVIADIESFNNVINQNSCFRKIKSQSPIRKISDIDSNVALEKKDSESLIKNIFNGSHVISYKSSTPTKSKNSSNLKKSEYIISKNFIGQIQKEIMDKNDINPTCPKSPQIGLGKNFSSNNIFLNSNYKSKYISKNYNVTKNVGFTNKNNKAQSQNENYKFLFSPKKFSQNNFKRKSSNLNEPTNTKATKNTDSNPNLKFCNNKYKINYTIKSYAEIKSKELTNEKQITQKVSNFKVNYKEIKSKFNELNNFNNLKKINKINNNSRNYQRENDLHQTQNILLSSCNYTTENFKQNLNEINDSATKCVKANLERERSPKSSNLNINSCINNDTCNNMLITNNEAIQGNINKYSNNFIDNKQNKKSSHLSCNFSNNLKLDLINKNFIYNKLGKSNKNSNAKNTINLKKGNIEQKESSDYIQFGNVSKEEKRKNRSGNSMVEVAVLTKESRENKKENILEINVENSDNTSIILDCYNENDLLDSKDYETKVSTNAALSVNQILTRTTKDDSIHHTIKNNNLENSIQNSNINGPEDLHFFYVNIFQKKRNYAPKFDH